MRRASPHLAIAFALLAIAGCTSSDLCEGWDFTCIGVHVIGSATVDQLRVHVEPGALEQVTPQTPSKHTLPLDTAVHFSSNLPPEKLTLTITGFRNGGDVGEGTAVVDVPPRHQTISVELAAPSDAGVDLGGVDAAVDLGGQDFANGDGPGGSRLIFLLPARSGALLAGGGGLASLDTLCTNAGRTARSGASFRAILGVPGEPPPVTHIALTATARPIALPSGKLVATDATFFTATHLGPIDETLDASAVGNCAWSDFGYDGAGVSTTADTTCSGNSQNAWSDGTGAAYGRTGNPNVYTSGAWTDDTNGHTCDTPCHVYCIEQ